ncbi:hypothetical protein MHU86_20264 [Fragilaria crotonensis]|nr:hypothetical protein MHU86_20264 [Fragilaria crotonensis]
MVLVNPQNNLPTSDAFNGQDPFKAADALVATITEVHETNHNLSEAEKELLRWHYRLGHIGFKKIQFLLRTGVLSQTEASRRLHSAACKLTNLPVCSLPVRQAASTSYPWFDAVNHHPRPNEHPQG